MLILVCKRHIDICFLIDVSSRVGRRNIVYIRRFVKEFVRRFYVTYRYTRIGIVIYSSRRQRIISFTQARSRTNVYRIIKRIRYFGGRAYTGRALYYVKKYLFIGKPQCGRKRVLIVVSSSVSRDSIVRPSKSLIAMGIETFVLVTNVKTYRQLRRIATTRTHVIMVSYRSIIKVVKRLSYRICKAPSGRVLANCLFSKIRPFNDFVQL